MGFHTGLEIPPPSSFLLFVNTNSQREAAFTETNELIRRSALWRDWSVTGTEASHLILGWL